MKSLSREAIQRMFNGESVGAGGGGNFDPSMISGLAQQSWVEENFVSIEFFGRLFKAYGPGETQGDPDVEVLPNDEETVISNIKAMFGFWTEQYLSALGQGSSGGGGGGGASALYELLDVKPNAGGDGVYGAAVGRVLTYGSDGKWYAAAVPASLTISDVWNALAANDSTNKIHESHFPTLFTSLTNVGTLLSITIGGVTKTLTVAYASSADSADFAASAPWSGITNVIEGDNEFNMCDAMPSNQRIWFNYQKRGQGGYLDASDTITEYQFGNGRGSMTGVTVKAENFLASGYVTALSDIRLKSVVGHVDLAVKDIAGVSLIRFVWKDGHDHREHVGGIAQEWQKLLPEAVHDIDGRLAMDYGTIAFTSAVSLARKVQQQERKIDAQQKEIDHLKAENAELVKRLSRLEKMFAITGEEDDV